MESSLPEALAKRASTFSYMAEQQQGGSVQMRDRAGAGENKPVSWRGSDGDITVGGSRVKETEESEESEEETDRFLACGGNVWERGQRRNNGVGCCLIRFLSFHFLLFQVRNSTCKAATFH